MKLLSQFGLACAILGFAISATAADVAVLHNGFSLRHERREQLGATTRLYLGSAPESGYIDVPTDEIASFQRDLTPPAPIRQAPTAPPKAGARDVGQVVSAASERHQVDADLIASVIRAESNFNIKAVSRKGAQGLMQLMPGTAAQLGVADAFEPEANVDAGTRYLRDLLIRYNNDIPKALAAYNAGAHRVQQYRGVPPYRETHAYVARIIRDFNHKKLAARKEAGAGRRRNARAAKSAKSLPTGTAESSPAASL